MGVADEPVEDAAPPPGNRAPRLSLRVSPRASVRRAAGASRSS